MSEATLTNAPAQTEPLAPSAHPLAAFTRRLWRDKRLGAIGGLVFALFLICGVFADLLIPYGMNETNLHVRLEGPSWAHWFGTDHLGRDLLSRVLIGAQLSMVVGFMSARPPK